MDRIQGANTIDQGGGKRGFRGKDTVAGVPGTEVRAGWLNAIQEEVVRAIELSGFLPSDADWTQLVQAIRSGTLNWKLVGGTANDLTVDLTPDLAAYTAGLPLNLLTGAAANTGAMTINVDGRGAKALLRRGGEAMAAGDVPAASLLEAVYDGAAFRSVGLVRSDIAAMALGAKLPIHAEVRTADGRLTLTPGAGNVVVTGATVLWRGWTDFDLSGLAAGNRTFATAANKTYHLRWDAPGTGLATPAATYPLGRLSLRDLADGAYNPSALAEDDTSFDTSFDSLLLHRVVTNGANAATVTALANKVTLRLTASRAPTKPAATFDQSHVTNWGRTPIVNLAGIAPPGGNRDTDPEITQVATRYATVVHAQGWSDEQVAGTQTAPSWGYTITQAA